MRTKLIAVAVVVALAAAVWWWRRGSESTTAETTRPSKPARTAPALRIGADVGAGVHSQYDDDPAGDQRLEGQVIDAEQRPVAGALVVIDANPRRETRTEGDGSFAFADLVPRIYRLEARAADGVAGPVRVRLSSTSEPVVLRLKTVASVEVTAVDAATGDAIEGALVELRGMSAVTASTDSAGAASIPGVGRGSHVLKVSAAGYASQFRALDSAGAAGERHRESFRLKPGVAVSGSVIDVDGRPIEGARVLAEDMSAALQRSSVRLDAAVTDAKGRWRIDALPRDTLRFRASHKRFAPGVSAPVPLHDGVERSGVTVRLEVGAVIGGRVVDGSGAGVPSAAVHVGTASPDVPLIRHTHCDEDGRFEIAGLPRQSLHVVATGEAASSALIAVDMARSPERTNLEIPLDQSHSIAGTVVDSAGEPVGEARVIARSADDAAVTYRSESRLRGHASDVADSGGGFKLVGLRRGAYRLRAIRPGASSELFWMKRGELVEADSGPVTLVVDETTSVVGKVAIAGGEAPALFNVAVGRGRAQSFSEGAFRIDEVPAGTTFVAIRGPDFESRVLEDVEVKPGEVTDLGTVTVQPGRVVRGRVIDGDGKPVAGAAVFSAVQLVADGLSIGSFRWAANDTRQSVSAADGSFAIRGNYGGTLVAAADHSELGRSRVAEIPLGDRDAFVELVLEPLGSLEGRVTVEGEPLESRVVLRPEQGSNTLYRVQSGTDGHYRFDKLAPGRYIATALRHRGSGTSGGGGHAMPVVIESGEVATLDIDMPVGDIEVTLELRSAAGDIEFGYGVIISTIIRDQPFTMTLSEGRKALASSKGGTLKEGVIVEDRSIAFSDVVPGDFTACAIPLPGDPRDPDNMDAFAKGNVDTKMFCRPFEVTSSPKAQTVGVDVALGDS